MGKLSGCTHARVTARCLVAKYVPLCLEELRHTHTSSLLARVKECALQRAAVEV